MKTIVIYAPNSCLRNLPLDSQKRIAQWRALGHPSSCGTATNCAGNGSSPAVNSLKLRGTHRTRSYWPGNCSCTTGWDWRTEMDSLLDIYLELTGFFIFMASVGALAGAAYGVWNASRHVSNQIAEGIFGAGIGALSAFVFGFLATTLLYTLMAGFVGLVLYWPISMLPFIALVIGGAMLARRVWEEIQ